VSRTAHPRSVHTSHTHRMPVSHAISTVFGRPGVNVTGIDGQRGNTLPEIRTMSV
jgi:hypothetical protein